MRRSPFEPRRSATIVLLVANVVAYILQVLATGFTTFNVNEYLALSVQGLRHGYVWQLLTFQFLHGGILHLVLNCWAIFVFGREVEEALGRRSFLTLYFSSGILGGLLQGLAGALLGAHYPQFLAPVVGASAGGFGLIAAFAVLYPERPLTTLLFFIIPITMRAKFLLLFSVIIAVIGLVFPGRNDNVAHAAHLGGIAAGILFVRYAVHWNLRWPQLNRSRRPPLRRLVPVHSTTASPWGRDKMPAAEDLTPEEFLSKEVDPILDKISAHGIQSLTERERRILESARARMGKR